MLIYDELSKDHRKLLATLDQLIASENAGPEVWSALVQQVRDELIPHSRAEEAILYNALRDENQTRDLVGHSYVEHAQAEAVLRSIQVSDAMNVSWVSAVKSLRDALAHHIHEEETELFAAARRVFSDQEATQMRDAFVAMKPQIKQEGLMGTTLDMIANMLPTRLRESVRKTGSDEAPVSRRRSSRSDDAPPSSVSRH